jgi:hypothetical protein
MHLVGFLFIVTLQLFVVPEIDDDKQEEEEEEGEEEEGEEEEGEECNFCSKKILPASYQSRAMKYPEGRIP